MGPQLAPDELGAAGPANDRGTSALENLLPFTGCPPLTGQTRGRRASTESIGKEPAKKYFLFPGTILGLRRFATRSRKQAPGS
jgi:hypothetical protein